MPTFGEFETVGQPYAVSDVRSHVSTIWQARKSGAGGEPLYAVKCYAPRGRAARPGQPEEALAHDRRLEFLEGIKQIKKTQTEGGRGLAPIYALGTTATEAWYVTDFYPRKDLQAWIDRKGEVDAAALRHVVHSVVTACLALKRSRGCSHGNLKPSNVFLGGKPRDLRQTPLLLADAYPAAPLQLARLEADDRHEAGELLHQVMEAQDLAVIGQLILQLVEGRLLSRSDDYNYPVERSPVWDALGKDGEYWLQWCNKLLNPQLSLETVNLETLATEFRPSAAAKRVPMILAGVVGVLVLSVGLYVVISIVKHRVEERRAALQAEHQKALENLAASIARGNELLEQADYAQAAVEFQKAARIAGDLKDANQKKTADEGQLYATALAQAKQAEAAGQVEDQIKGLEKAQKLRPSPKVEAWLTAAKQEKERQIAAQKRKELDDAINSGAGLLEQDSYAQAAVEFQKATGLAADLNDADQIKTADDGQRYATALAQAKQAKAAGQVSEEIKCLEAARKIRRDAKVEDWLSDARQRHRHDEEIKTHAQKLADLEAAINQGDRLVGQTNYADAVTEFRRAVKLADELKDAGKRNTANEGQQFASDLAQAKAASQVGEEIKWLEAALKIRRDAKVDDWLLDARQRHRHDEEIKTHAQKLADLEAAIKQGNRLLGQTDYASAAIEFQRAVTLADELNDAGKKKAADEGQRFASDLAQAKAAGQVDDEIKWLEAALRIRQDVKVAAWMDDAKGRRVVALKRKDFHAAIEEGTRLLEETNFVRAADEFRTAAKIAGDLNDADRKTSASDGLSLATALHQAEAARKSASIDEEITRLQEAVKFKGAPKMVSGWLADAKRRADEARALKEAPAYFGQGKYDEALKLCQDHPSVQRLRDLAKSIESEEAALVDTTSKFSKGDYSFIEQLKSQSYSGKKPFADLLAKAAEEKKALGELDALKQTNKWVDVKARLTDTASRGFASKGPFVELLGWARVQEDAIERQHEARLRSLDEQLEVLCVEFGLLKPKNAKTEQGKKAEKLGTIGLENQRYLAIVIDLQSKFNAGELNQNERRRNLESLKKAIKNWP